MGRIKSLKALLEVLGHINNVQFPSGSKVPLAKPMLLLHFVWDWLIQTFADPYPASVEPCYLPLCHISKIKYWGRPARELLIWYSLLQRAIHAFGLHENKELV